MNGQELIERFVAQTSVDRERADRFYKEFFQVLVEGLEKDGYVRVKGLGSFKLLVVERRESININTGERFEIQGHNRISFTPEPGLKELVNKPFAHLETVVIDAGGPLAAAAAVEGKAGEAGAVPVETMGLTAAEAAVETKTESVEAVVEKPTETVETVVETAPETVSEATVETIPETVAVGAEAVKSAESEDIKEKESEEAVVETPAESISSFTSTPFPAEKKQAKDQTPAWLKVAGWIMAVVFVLCVIALLMLYIPGLRKLVFEKRVKEAMEMQVEAPTAQKLPEAKTEIPATVSSNTATASASSASASASTASVGDGATKTASQATTVSTTVNANVQTAASATSSNTVLAASTPTKPAVESAATSTQLAAATAIAPDSVNYEIVGTQAEYTIGEGETLARVALHFYGTKALWPYIVKYNAAIIPNPDRVTSGLRVRIPRLQKKGE
ncbi:MAG: HU family DNA-binding protein [Prevotellaceae bacterium]|nr:HU family DNA-binding protein [Prevotellaceae bacterium]